MKLSGLALASSRRVVVACGLSVAMLSVSGLRAEQAAPAAAPAAQVDAFKFTSDAAGIIWTVKEASAADFESIWKAVQVKLAASEKPDLKALGAGLKIYRVVPMAPLPAAPGAPAGAPPQMSVTYIFVADPASKAVTYDPVYLLFDTTAGLFPRAEADAMFAKLQTAIANISPLPMNVLK